MAGKVYLVGAGPGEPSLMTLRGAELLGRAQVVVYDHLASQELVSLTPKDCQWIDAGKRAHNHALSQDQINQLLAQKAQEGLLVIRLKGGDPYVFGRGGEEALYLAERGLDFEVIPGVSSTIAVANAAGVPLTHRELSSQVTLLTGHGQANPDAPEQNTLTIDFKYLNPKETLSIVMGRQNLGLICQELIKAHWPPETLAVAIENGFTPLQKTVSATLASLEAEVAKAGLKPPTLIVIGQVASLRERLNWFEKRPLFGQTILVTRTRAQASQLSASLRELGARVLERPAIAIEPLRPNPALDSALGDLSKRQYLVLTSPNGAEIFFAALKTRGLDGRALHSLKIVALGPGTAAKISEQGLIVDYSPKFFQAEGLLELFKELPKGSVLWPRAAGARDVLAEGLLSLGFEIKVIDIYQTQAIPNFIKAQDNFDLATITSSSVAKSLAASLGERLSAVKTISIGPIATKTAREAGLNVVAESRKASIPSLIETVAQYFGQTKDAHGH
ncbi:MAG: uroporphyrinogen-III C-methyltransferase [Deltaproteobacteria bacterium]|jgi:uroporphyrinogen III methyltransferase/synthase|nr:uroporphyrinogen-III C-methyltransferase [Deltaproteobacteria bacterium]